MERWDYIIQLYRTQVVQEGREEMKGEEGGDIFREVFVVAFGVALLRWCQSWFKPEGSGGVSEFDRLLLDRLLEFVEGRWDVVD